MAFLEVRRETLEWVRTTDIDLRAFTASNPVTQKDLEGFQWMIFLTGHSARHTDQIREIKTASRFPSK